MILHPMARLHAGGRLLTFLAGCPDHGRGAVLHQPQDLQTLQQVPYDAGAMPDSNPYAYLPILSQVSKANDESAKSLAAANGSSAAVSIPNGYSRYP